jgi:hypothetical protein
MSNVTVSGEYRPETKSEWKEKIRRYYAARPVMALSRLVPLANGTGCWDWDDTIPQEWAKEMLLELLLELCK